MTKAEYQTYLASREWAKKREAVRARSKGICERCLERPMTAVHHRTYARTGDEWLTDLMAICDPCHAYLSGKIEDDPRQREVCAQLLSDAALDLLQLAERCLDVDGTDWLVREARAWREVLQMKESLS